MELFLELFEHGFNNGERAGERSVISRNIAGPHEGEWHYRVLLAKKWLRNTKRLLKIALGSWGPSVVTFLSILWQIKNSYFHSEYLGKTDPKIVLKKFLKNSTVATIYKFPLIL